MDVYSWGNFLSMVDFSNQGIFDYQRVIQISYETIGIGCLRVNSWTITGFKFMVLIETIILNSWFLRDSHSDWMLHIPVDCDNNKNKMSLVLKGAKKQSKWLPSSNQKELPYLNGGFGGKIIHRWDMSSKPCDDIMWLITGGSLSRELRSNHDASSLFSSVDVLHSILISIYRYVWII